MNSRTGLRILCTNDDTGVINPCNLVVDGVLFIYITT